jgi:phosphoglycolate phosphatase-like HAD superfamily hydrolase
MHITSGSDQEELRFLCKSLSIDHLFDSIHGSPTPKKQLVKELIEKNGYVNHDCVLIGDSINDYDAAVDNKVVFIGYNNTQLSSISKNYIYSFNKVFELCNYSFKA